MLRTYQRAYLRRVLNVNEGKRNEMLPQFGWILLATDHWRRNFIKIHFHIPWLSFQSRLLSFPNFNWLICVLIYQFEFWTSHSIQNLRENYSLITSLAFANISSSFNNFVSWILDSDWKIIFRLLANDGNPSTSNVEHKLEELFGCWKGFSNGKLPGKVFVATLIRAFTG